jgi:hypothetical protein
MNMKKKLFTIFILLFSSGIFAQGVYNNGGKIVIGTGVYLCINGTGGNYRNETHVTDGSIDLSGTLKIDGNYTNNVSSSDILSSSGAASLVLFTGSAGQTIGGTTSTPFVFNNLTINNSNGIVVSKAARVNGILTFINGLANIGNNDFVFGSSASVAGTPSTASMIVATGTGQVKKLYGATGSFTFPVGDNNLSAKYSPVTLNITSGTFAAGAFAGVNLVNASYPDPVITGSYLNRYWNITQTGISGFSCDAVFQYLPADVTGTESDISCLLVNPLPVTVLNPANNVLHQLSATGLSSFGTFTGGPGFKTLSLKLYLEGLYTGGGVMAQAQGNTGNQYPGLTSDDISVELHNSVTYATLVYTANNINLSTTGIASFTVPATYNGSYYLTIKHRNSIATVSSTPVSFASSTINYDFSNLATKAYGNNEKNAGGVFLIYGGDVDQDGFVGVSDMANVDNQSALFGSGYLPEDIDGDGFVGVADMAIIDNNSANFISTVTP